MIYLKKFLWDLMGLAVIALMIVGATGVVGLAIHRMAVFVYRRHGVTVRGIAVSGYGLGHGPQHRVGP